jgi:hypothetical protein
MSLRIKLTIGLGFLFLGILSIVVDEKVKRCLRSRVFGGLSGYRLLGDRSL